jgi:hypothetical protein
MWWALVAGRMCLKNEGSASLTFSSDHSLTAGGLAPNATHFGLIIKFLSSPPCGGMIFALPALARNLRKRIGPVDHCQFVRGHGCLRILF